MVDVDVLIVGGGPTGLTLALELAVQKVSFRIINKEAERSPYSRALVVHPRSQELLNRHGNIQRLLSKGLTARGTTIAVHGKRVTEMVTDFVGITPTRFPAPKSVSQAETEDHLDKLLAEHGAAAEMGVEAKIITPDADGVTVVLLDAKTGQEVSIRAKYVVGADGAHSIVRHSAQSITFDGDAYPQEFILADTHFKSDQPPDMAYFCLGTGVCVMLPMQDHRVRLIVSRPNQPGEHEPLGLDEFRDFLKTVFPGEFELYDPVWLSAFHLHHRLASSYREGRLLLAGDAAHIHSPAGGQGMNTGIQDAINLGWKLAAVLRGEKPDAFLDSYNAERRPVGEYLLRNSDRMFSFMTTQNRFWLWLRNTIVPWVMPWVTSSPARVLNSVKFMTQLGIKYRRSPIVGTAAGFDGPVKGGFRAPEGTLRGPEGEVYLQDLCSPESHHLVLFSGSQPSGAVASEGDLQRAEARFLEASGTKAKVHTIFGEDYSGQAGWVDVDGETHKAYGFSQTSGYVLVRPDGYVAHIGPLSAFDDLISWMQQ